MKGVLIPAEVIAHFDIQGKITPYKIKYEEDGIRIIQITRLIRRSTNTFAGNYVEVYECAALENNCEVMFVLNFEKKLSKWFLTKI